MKVMASEVRPGTRMRWNLKTGVVKENRSHRRRLCRIVLRNDEDRDEVLFLLRAEAVELVDE